MANNSRFSIRHNEDDSSVEIVLSDIHPEEIIDISDSDIEIEEVNEISRTVTEYSEDEQIPRVTFHMYVPPAQAEEINRLQEYAHSIQNNLPFRQTFEEIPQPQLGKRKRSLSEESKHSGKGTVKKNMKREELEYAPCQRLIEEDEEEKGAPVVQEEQGFEYYSGEENLDLSFENQNKNVNYHLQRMRDDLQDNLEGLAQAVRFPSTGRALFSMIRSFRTWIISFGGQAAVDNSPRNITEFAQSLPLFSRGQIATPSVRTVAAQTVLSIICSNSPDNEKKMKKLLRGGKINEVVADIFSLSPADCTPALVKILFDQEYMRQLFISFMLDQLSLHFVVAVTKASEMISSQMKSLYKVLAKWMAPTLGGGEEDFENYWPPELGFILTSEPIPDGVIEHWQRLAADKLKRDAEDKASRDILRDYDDAA